MNPIWQTRWHPLRGEWILFTEHRGARPWIGETRASETTPPSYDPDCALCPGNARLGSAVNPAYTAPFVFRNDLPAFGQAEGSSEPADPSDDLYRSGPADGCAEVICYHPDHSKTMADLDQGEVEAVVQLWQNRSTELAAREEINHVLIFENKGAVTGTSNPHPHGQLYASRMIYGITQQELEQSQNYWNKHQRFLGSDLLDREARGPRVVCENEDWLACVPWFARYAYEILILPKQPTALLSELNAPRRASLAAMLREVCVRYDNLWQMRMPYVMAIHQAPTDGIDRPWFPFHFEFHPPLRNPDTLKYLAGPEIGGGTMTNESDPDKKAAELRAVSDILYRKGAEA